MVHRDPPFSWFLRWAHMAPWGTKALRKMNEELRRYILQLVKALRSLEKTILEGSWEQRYGARELKRERTLLFTQCWSNPHSDYDWFCSRSSSYSSTLSPSSAIQSVSCCIYAARRTHTLLGIEDPRNSFIFWLCGNSLEQWLKQIDKTQTNTQR